MGLGAAIVEAGVVIQKLKAAQRVFAEYGDATVLFSTHYRLWITACTTPPEAMTRADIRRLAGDGWKWDAKLESWTLEVRS